MGGQGSLEIWGFGPGNWRFPLLHFSNSPYFGSGRSYYTCRYRTVSAAGRVPPSVNDIHTTINEVPQLLIPLESLQYLKGWTYNSYPTYPYLSIVHLMWVQIRAISKPIRPSIPFLDLRVPSRSFPFLGMTKYSTVLYSTFDSVMPSWSQPTVATSIIPAPPVHFLRGGWRTMTGSAKSLLL